jgi:alanyl-tRNA synthetase
MTDRLYYNDPYLRSFEAAVTGAERRGERIAVTLDRTAFYPTSGGQPFDVGTLNGAAVVDVVDENGGGIVHLLEASPEALALRPDTRVRGEIDWTRRFDHMQQHTGQHVLSAAFSRVFGAQTVSFHLGAEASTIDLARELSPAEIADGESEANRIVWEDRPVAIRFVTHEEAASLPLRKEPVRGGTLRLIDVEAWDLSACGGTHVGRTGAIGLIAVVGWERFKGGQRLEFLCGGRALARMRAMRDSLGATTRLLSILPSELPAAIERLQSEAKEQKRTIAAMQEELARHRATALAASAESTSAGRLVLQAVDGDANALRTLAVALTAGPGVIAGLVSTRTPTLVVVARSADVAISAQAIVKDLIAWAGGRGGGRPELAQAGGLDLAPATVLDRIRTTLLS